MGEFGEDVTVTAAPNAREFAGRIAQDGSINNPPSTYAMKNYLPSAKAASTSTKAITLSRKQSDQNRGVAFPPKKPSGGLDHQVSIDVSEARTEDDTSESSSRRNSIERNTASSTPAASDMEEALAELDDDFMARLPSARVIPVEEGAELSDQSTSIVLPCAPDDTEKVMYYRACRLFLLPFGILSFTALAAGMSLFTLTSVWFYWFGVPTFFLVLYLGFHYFGISVWGKDFNSDGHAKIVRQAEESTFTPTVDVYLPVCKEPIGLLANTWKFVKELEYPHVTVHVLDDGAKDDVRDLSIEFGFRYIRRPNRPELKKAGNLRYAFARTSGEMILILDADFCPRPEFLRETLPYFMDASVGIVQTPQYFRWREEQTWVEQGAGVTQELFYRMGQVNNNRRKASYCVGTCGVYRRAALDPLGGMAAVSHSEDIMTGFMLPGLGFQVSYLPLVMAMGICPDDPRTFFMQQYRWCMGSAALVMSRGFWKSNVSKMQKLCFLSGMMYYVATAVLIFLAPLPILLLILLEASGVRWFHMAFTVPVFIFALVVLPLWSRQRYGMSCHRVTVLQSYAHLYAIRDYLMGTSAPWVPSGGKSSRSSSKAYNSSKWLLIIWNTSITVLIVGGAAWRIMDFAWYHFVPSIALALLSFALHLSTLCD